MASTDIYPLAPVLATLSLMVVLLDIPPLLWHIQRRNFSFISLIIWLVLLNLFSTINAILWPTSSSLNTYDGNILCDIEAKVMVGAYIGLPCAFAAILRSLAAVLDTNSVNLAPTAAQKRRALAVDLTICWVPAILIMGFNYIIQGSRYFLFPISGCDPSIDNSLPSIFLLYIWPAVAALVDAYYAFLLLWRLYVYRREFANILQAAATTRSRFLKPLMLSVLCGLAIVPLSFYMLALNVGGGFHEFEWHRVHDPKRWNNVGYVDLGNSALPDRWVWVGTGALVFVFFGLGQDAKKMYTGWLVKMGFGKVWPKLPRKSGAGKRGGKSSTGLGKKLKRFKLNSKVESDRDRLRTQSSGETSTLPSAFKKSFENTTTTASKGTQTRAPTLSPISLASSHLEPNAAKYSTELRDIVGVKIKRNTSKKTYRWSGGSKRSSGKTIDEQTSPRSQTTADMPSSKLWDMPYDGHSHQKEKGVISTASGRPSGDGMDDENETSETPTKMKDGDVYVSKKVWDEEEEV